MKKALLFMFLQNQQSLLNQMKNEKEPTKREHLLNIAREKVDTLVTLLRETKQK